MKAIKPTPWILAAVAALLILGFWLRRDFPNEAQARRDFLAEHPTFTVERVNVDEQEVVAIGSSIEPPAIPRSTRSFASISTPTASGVSPTDSKTNEAHSQSAGNA
jgi:hypothetical protein